MMNFVGSFGLQRFNPPAANKSVVQNAAVGDAPGVAFLELPDPGHNSVVASTLVQSGADPANVGFIAANGNIRQAATPEQFLANSVSDALNNVSSQIEGLSADPNNRIRVLNMSFSSSTLANTQGFINEYNGNPTFQAQTRAAAGIPDNASPAEQTQAIYNYIQNTLATNPESNQAMARYQQATKTAAERGISIVVAAGNNQEQVQGSINQGFSLPDDLAYNYFAKSDHVISVAAIDDKDSPGFSGDDQIAPFSARGNNRFHATLSADGVNIQGRNGTSFAAPQVSGTIAAMLRANPNLTYQQINQILRLTAKDNPNISAREEGAGLLQADAAISLAAQQPGAGQDVVQGIGPAATFPTEGVVAAPAPFVPTSGTPAMKRRAISINNALAENSKSYKVKSGDTLSAIVLVLQKQPGYKGNGNLQEDIRKLAAANRLNNPNLIHTDSTLDLSSLAG